MLWAKIKVGKNTKIEQCVSASDELSDYDDDDGVEQLWLHTVSDLKKNSILILSFSLFTL